MGRIKGENWWREIKVWFISIEENWKNERGG